MKDVDISLLLSKAEELRALFILGQRVIPFLEEIFIFVNDIRPLLDEINLSIEENLKKMPTASKQLSKVTEATEMATTEIMDIVDGLVYKANLLQSNNIKLQELYAVKSSDQNAEFQQVFDNSNNIIQSISDDSTNIMMSLQVQDITSQQIAAVNHLLETIQAKLSKILVKFQSSELSDMIQGKPSSKERANVSQMHRPIAFDPEAVDSYTNKDTRQNDVDEIFGNKGHYEKAELSEQASAEDIDSLFASNTQPDAEEPASNDDGIEQVSQDDIDALFGK